MKSLWTETKRVPVVSKLVSELRQLQQELAEDDGVRADALKAEINKREALIAKRKADPEMFVTVKHVGTPEEPGAWDRLTTQQAAERHAEEVRIRMGLLKAHGSPQQVAQDHGAKDFQEALLTAFWTDPTWKGLITKHYTQMCEAGLVDGAAEAKRLVAYAGPAMLAHAAVEVRLFQEVDVEMGEG
jgi:hypothetical protein